MAFISNVFCLFCVKKIEGFQGIVLALLLIILYTITVWVFQYIKKTYWLPFEPMD